MSDLSPLSGEEQKLDFGAVRSVDDAVDGSSTGTRVPRLWEQLRLPRFGGAIHANGYDNRS